MRQQGSLKRKEPHKFYLKGRISCSHTCAIKCTRSGLDIGGRAIAHNRIKKANEQDQHQQIAFQQSRQVERKRVWETCRKRSLAHLTNFWWKGSSLWNSSPVDVLGDRESPLIILKSLTLCSPFGGIYFVRLVNGNKFVLYWYFRQTSSWFLKCTWFHFDDVLKCLSHSISRMNF